MCTELCENGYAQNPFPDVSGASYCYFNPNQATAAIAGGVSACVVIVVIIVGVVVGMHLKKKKDRNRKIKKRMDNKNAAEYSKHIKEIV